MRKNSTRIILVAISFVLNTSLFAADFVVTSTADSGPGSLRQAIADATASPGADNITFNLGGLTTIELLSPLVVNTEVNITGYSATAGAPGSISGRSIAVAVTASGFNAFEIYGSNVTISGLAIYGGGSGAYENGIYIGQTAALDGPIHIWGNYIGFDEFGFPGAGGTGNGVVVDNDRQDIFTYANPRVIIGSDLNGTADAFEGNLISHNTTAGVYINNADNVNIVGNYIGTSIGGAGITSWNFGNGEGIVAVGWSNPAENGSSNIRIEQNVISGNKLNGIRIGGNSQGNYIIDNIIGMRADLLATAPNRGNNPLFSGNGILIAESRNMTIEGNIVSGNTRNGITLYSSDATSPADNNLIQGNRVGYNVGANLTGNGGWGVQLVSFGSGSVSSNIIGSNDDGANDAAEANTIINNGKDGVGLQENIPGTVRLNRISRNSFSNNKGPSGGEGAGLAINLIPSQTPSDGITVNDPGDTDDGPNGFINFPEVTQFGVDPLFISVTGTVAPGATVQFYLASADAAPSNPNFKEGAVFLFQATDNAYGDDDPTPGVFNFLVRQQDLGAPVAAGNEINAITLSAASGPANTSEFSSSTAAILPVQFLSFDATLKGDKVLVSWTTAQERNASHFEVEKSTDGQNFKTIGRVNAAGNSSRKIDYSFTDNNVESGISYYRLRQVDLDAKAVFTRVVPIRNEGRAGKAFFMWPNPVIDVLNITINQTKPETLSVRVVDMNGRTLNNKVVNTVRGLNQVTLNMNGLQRGMYIIQVVGDETKLTQKILKN